MHRKGFTLVELLVVVAVISILASISIANFSEYREKALNTVAISQAHDAMSALEATEESLQSFYRILFIVTKSGREISAANSQPIQSAALQRMALTRFFPAFKKDPDIVIAFGSTPLGIKMTLALNCKARRDKVAMSYQGLTKLVTIAEATSLYGVNITPYCAN